MGSEVGLLRDKPIRISKQFAVNIRVGELGLSPLGLQWTTSNNGPFASGGQMRSHYDTNIGKTYGWNQGQIYSSQVSLVQRHRTMKSHLVATLSIFCLSAGLLGFVAGVQTLARSQDGGLVASEYNPPGRGGTYPGGTRFDQQPGLGVDV